MRCSFGVRIVSLVIVVVLICILGSWGLKPSGKGKIERQLPIVLMPAIIQMMAGYQYMAP